MLDSDLCSIGLSMAKGMTRATATELLRRIGSPQAFFSMPRWQLAAMAGTESEIFADDYRSGLMEHARKEAVFVEHNSLRPLIAGTEGYPARLENCDDAPYVAYQLGACDLDAPHFVGIVGTRHATPYGIDFTTHLVAELAEKLDTVTIVSGLAYGIDVAAHKSALQAGVPTVAVMAHGLHMIYPADHRSIAVRIVDKGGALITEYPSGTRPHPSNFLARNRIVAGICDCLVVVESDNRGGSMSTARMASLYGREVFALPGRVNDVYSRGTNRLIFNNTAMLVRNADDIIDQMGWTRKAAKPKQPTLFPVLSPAQQQIYDFIVANPDATANDICARLGMPFAAVSNIIFELEMEDAIVAMPGGRYAPSCRNA